MRKISVLIGLELLLAVTFVTLPPAIRAHIPHPAHVLGVKLLADEAATAPADVSATPAPPGNLAPLAPTTDTTPPRDTSTAVPAATDAAPATRPGAVPGQNTSGAIPPTDQPPAVPSVNSQPTDVPKEDSSSVFSSSAQSQAVLNPTELLNTPENISDQTVKEVTTEETRLAQAQTPSEKTQLLLTFAQDKVHDVAMTAQNGSFADTHFANQRLQDQLTTIIDAVKNLPPQQAVQAQATLVKVCSTADPLLRTSQLLVPEASEQDLAINRGICMSVLP